MLRKTALFVHLFLFAAMTVAGSSFQLPDVRAGVINGRVATLVWPGRYSVDQTKPELLDPQHCTAHFVSSSDPDREEIHPCGQWVRPRPDTYRVWLELSGFISPFPSLLRYSDVAGDRGILNVMPVVRAGMVQLANSSRNERSLSFRLLSLNTHFLNHLQRVFDRRVGHDQRTVSMPAGKIVGGLFDRTSGDAVALSKVVSVTPTRATLVDPQPPLTDSDVLVVLQRPAFGKEGDIRLLLADTRSTRSPDVFVPASDVIFAIWYGATGKTARVTAESSTFALTPMTLMLKPRRVSTFRGRLDLLPKISVSIVAPADAFSNAEISITRTDDLSPIRRVRAREGAALDITGMPLALLDVTLVIDGWEFKERVDLRGGSDGTVVFTLQPLAVHGTIYWGNERAPAKVSFAFDEKQWASFESDASGHYEGMLWKPALYPARITLNDAKSAPPFFELVDVSASTTIDFHIPRNRVVVHVVDAVGGRPIPGATVGVESVWNDRADKEVRISQPYVADASGTAVMPPLHAGQVRIHASADRYIAAELETFEIDRSGERELTIALRPASIARTKVLLPGSAPAAGAEAAVVVGFANVVWRGKAGPDGNLEVPVNTGDAVLVIRHPNAGSAAQSTRIVPETVRLRPASPTPLLLRTEERSREAIPFAFLTIWVDGLALSGAAAAFATWTPIAATGADALWLGRNLPAAATRILATKRISPEQIASGAYDRLATTISYPWLSTAVTIEPVQQ